MEGEEQKIAVAGTFERNQTVLEFHPAPIAKRHDACVLETEDGIVLHIYGSLNISRMHDNGFSTKVCEKFLNGFPHWWQSCNLLYPKVTGSHTECQPSSSSSYTSNSIVDSTKFYLERFQMGKRLHSHGSSLIRELLNKVKNFSFNLSNGAPRFEEYTCDGDSATNENAAASNDYRERHQAVCSEVDNVEVHLTAGRTLRERDHGDIATNVPLAPKVECANDAGNEEADNAPTTSACNQGTPVAAANENMPTSVCLDAQNSSYLSNGIPRLKEYTCMDGIPTNEKAVGSNDDSERYASASNEVDSVEIEFIAGSSLRESYIGDINTNVSIAFTEDRANDVGIEESRNAPPRSTCGQRTPLVSLKIQGCQKKAWHVGLSKEAAADQEMPTSVYLDVQNSSYLSYGTPTFEQYTCIGDIRTNEDAAALNGNSEKHAAVSMESNNMEIGLIAGNTVRGDHDDIATNVSLIPALGCSSDAFNEALYNTPPIGCKKTPAASLKSQGCRRNHQLIASNEKPAVPSKKQRSANEKLLGATRCPLTRSPVPYGYRSPLTRSRATSMSMSTPEDLKLRKTRSGRVVVPPLDAGSQRIVYDMYGSVSGVIGLDSLPTHKRGKIKN